MSPLFRRGAKQTSDEPATEPLEPAEPATGPFDVSHPQAPTTNLVDLGAIRLAARKDIKVRLDVDRGSGTVAAVTVGAGASSVQLTVFAAPRSTGVWDEVRAEIATAIAASGGTTQEQPGSFGAELLAKVPGVTPDGTKVVQVQRFCGVDGPRWFLRAVFSGPDVLAAAGARVPEEALSQGRGEVLEEVVRGSVVVRGPSPLAPREPLPLRVPEQTRQAVAAAAAERVAAERAAVTGESPSSGVPDA